jgi:L-fuculose-phosphate aldolase
MHLGIYRQCPEVEAVVHAHPIYATAFGLAGRTVPTEFLPEALLELGPVALVPFALPGTDEVPNSLSPFLGHHRTFLLSNHGAVTVGKSLREATHRMEVLERIAQITYLSHTLGPPRPLTPAQLARLEAVI